MTRVVLACNTLGYGGTEKGLVALATALDRSRLDVRVVALLEDGPRRAQLEAAGISVTCVEGDRERLVAELEGVDVVHVFRIGLGERLLPAACRQAGVPVLVETNIFGQVDASDDERQFAAHLFISRMCALRYRRRLDLEEPGFHERHAVWSLPVDVASLRAAAPDRRAAKRALGLNPDRPVIGRTGRDDDRKWRGLLVDMLPTLLERVPEAQVLYVGATPAILRRLERRGVLDRVTVPPMAPEELVPTLYAACDVFVNGAEIGEAQGLVLVEAMGLGVPVVTSSTPWVDNAQVEVIDDGVTGFVADHPAAFAEAVAELLRDDELRARMGAAAEAEALARYDPARQAAQIERLYASLLAGDGIPAEWSPSSAQVDDFPAEYERRLHARRRPLTGRERGEVQLTRARERTTWALRAAAGLDRARLEFLYWMLRARLPGGSERGASR